jgi:hydroxybutyrate-dimer hydrolase
MSRGILILALALWLPACTARAPDAGPAVDVSDFLASEIRETRHEGEDDLLSAGLGLAGLRGPQPRPADSEHPSAAELRRLAIHTNWRGIGDLGERGGFGVLYGGVPAVPGREFAAFARIEGAKHPHRVLAQVPDAFDLERRCLIVGPASGSRGVYGAIALAGAFGLPRGCAIAYTDKGAGTDYFDFASNSGVALDGTRAPAGRALAFEPEPLASSMPIVAMPHAHSGDHPEADWGRHVIQAAQFGLHALDLAFPSAAPFSAENTIIVAAAVSNGGGAVLRALELDEAGLFDAGLAVAPNISAPGARALFDLATEAALLQPCLLATPEARDWPLYGANALIPIAAQARCASLHAQGLVASADPEEAGAEVREKLLAAGFTPPALEQSAVNVGFDLWRAVAASYASAYLRRPADDMPCGFAVVALDATYQPRASTPAERAVWWATTTGIAPTAELMLVDTGFKPPDALLAGQHCLRRLWTGDDETAQELREAVAATKASARLPEIPVLVIHGTADGLVPAAFTSRPYVEAVRETGGRQLTYWEIERVQHFDAFLELTELGRTHLPLMPYAFEGLEQLFAQLFDAGPPLRDQAIAPPPRGEGVLDRAALGLR